MAGLDAQIVVFGKPGFGKSTWAYQRAVELSREAPSYLLVHDPRWTHKVAHRPVTEGEALAILKAGPKGSLALPVDDGDRAAQIALDVAKTASVRGKQTILLLDEGVAAKGLSAYRLGDNLKTLMTQRRHFNMGLIVTSQSPDMTHKSIMALATEIVVFRLSSKPAIDLLVDYGLPEPSANQVRTLPKFKAIRFYT